MNKTVCSKLLEIQRELKCEKSQFNKFGGYAYRSKEDILEAVKPLAHKRDCIVIVRDHISVLSNGWVYVEADAYLIDIETGADIHCSGYAREPESKKGMDPSQITGTAASYAGKRALGNLFAIDDTKDADSLNTHESPQNATRGAKHSQTDIELWEAVKAYSEAFGCDPKTTAEEIKAREEYDGTDECKSRLAEELRDAIYTRN